MCYSALIKANLKALSLEFHAQVDLDAFGSLLEARILHPELKVPFGLDRYFVLSQDPAEKRLAPIVKEFHAGERLRVANEIAATESEMRALAQAKPTAANTKKIEVRERRLLKLKSKLELSFDRITPLDERIFPGVFAPVIRAHGDQRSLGPMRYRVRRPDGGEIPSQYNVFNARRDSLLRADTWKNLFGRSHAIFPFVKFFEWVERDGKKREFSFTPENRTMMWAASLYSEPRVKNTLPYPSFAMVTDEPPPEIAAAGHDRCPVFLSADAVNGWLYPQNKSTDFLDSLLENKEKAYYINALVA